ncbi:hypothetical protein [Paenibacillus forsythiae]|uniref:hypothetical protein n=1 Tax=Paenibacillus forsythiae TaxID=365616 RepID=UPI00289A74D9|nr:hypothetical protein [Paenibacillus forsythiae]
MLSMPAAAWSASRSACVRMFRGVLAEARLNDLRMEPLVQQQGGRGMPQRMEVDIAEAV